MGGMSWIHWVIVIALIALLFGGRGKLSSIMGDAAKGIKAFKDGLKNDGEDADRPRPVEPLPRTEREKEEARLDR
jgi:sec-independent protein translocase protein TatA